LLDVQAVVKVNAVMRAGVAANDVEEVEQLELISLSC
jgi:hypothetical protein